MGLYIIKLVKVLGVRDKTSKTDQGMHSQKHAARRSGMKLMLGSIQGAQLGEDVKQEVQSWQGKTRST